MMKPASEATNDAGIEAPVGPEPATAPELPRRERLKDAGAAFSLAHLCLINAWYPLLFTTHGGYYNKIPFGPKLVLALAANLALFTLLFWVAARLVRRLERPAWSAAATLAFGVVLLVPADFMRVYVLMIGDQQVLRWLTHPGIALGLLASIAGAVRWHRLTMRCLRAFVLILLPMAGFTFAKIGWLLATRVASTPSPATAPVLGTNAAAAPVRVVWMIFDEMDQRTAFGQRPAGLQLPEFDRLRQESLYAENAFPPAANTRMSMPSLISGRAISNAVPRGPDELVLTLADTGQAVGWSTLPNVFSAARSLGLPTALVGWYHPYDRVLRGSLDYCAWHPFPMFEPARSERLLGTMGREIASMVSPLHQRWLHVELYRRSLADARTVVRDRRYGCVLLHFSVPHKPGIYQPATQRLVITGMPQQAGYLNNLVLTDRTLGELRREMEQAGLWDQCWVVISSDHWWRQAAIHPGPPDHRVPFLVKSPGPGQPTTYSRPFNTVLTHDLILAVLRRELTRADELAAWLDAHRVEPPAHYSKHPGE